MEKQVGKENMDSKENYPRQEITEEEVWNSLQLYFNEENLASSLSEWKEEEFEDIFGQDILNESVAVEEDISKISKKLEDISPQEEEKLFLYRTEIRGDTKVYICNLCNEGCSSQEEIMQHLLKHDGGPFHCDICGKNFEREKYLKTHLKNHSQKSLYPCVNCGNTYKSKYSFRKHKCGQSSKQN